MKSVIKQIGRFVLKQEYRVPKLIRFYSKYRESGNYPIRLLSICIRKRILKRYKIDLGNNFKAGNNLSMPHPQNIVLGNEVVIGNNCRIYQDVTIGQNKGLFPKVGNNVTIYAGAKIIGNISIGDNVIVGANAVVTKDVPNNCVIAGVPAKILKRLE